MHTPQAVLLQEWMVAGSQLVVQYGRRRRLDDIVGLGLLIVATLLSFTGLVDLARYMHPIRFVLLLSTAISCYRVTTQTFCRLHFTAEAIERRGPLQRSKHWSYGELAEVREKRVSLGLFGEHDVIQIRFRDGSALNVDCSMTNAVELMALLRKHERHFTATLA